MDGDARRFFERFTMIMSESGYPLMAARVFVAILLSEAGELTAGQLAATLGTGRSAISGAVTYLLRVGMVVRERAPGERRDRYRIHEAAWYGALRGAGEVFRRFEEGAREGVEVYGAGTPVGARLQETRNFFAYLGREAPLLLQRWNEAREHHPDARPR